MSDEAMIVLSVSGSAVKNVKCEILLRMEMSATRLVIDSDAQLTYTPRERRLGGDEA